MTFFAEIKKIVVGGIETRITADGVRALIKKTADHLAELEVKRECLAEERVKALLSGTNEEIRKADDALAALKIDRERLEAAMEVLIERRDILVETERVERAMRERAELEERVAAVAEKLSKKYPPFIVGFRDLIREIAEADAAVAAFHRAHPDAPEVMGVEARCRYSPMTREVVHTEAVWAWRAPNGKLFSHDEAPDVRPEIVNEPDRRSAVPRLRAIEAKPRRWLDEIASGRASADAIYRSGHGVGHVMKPVRATRRIVKIVPCDTPSPLATTLRLPPLRAGMAGFGPLASADPRLVIAALSMPAAAPEPEQKIELIEINPEEPAQ